MTNGVLLDRQPEDAEELLAAWLAPVRRSGVAYGLGDPLPFTLITQIGGTENPNIETADPLVSVHTLCDKTLGYDAAKAECDKTHRAITELARWCDAISLSGGRTATLDYVVVFQAPVWVVYEDVAVIRKVGRYRLGLCYTAATP